METELKCACNDPKCKTRIFFSRGYMWVEGNTLAHGGFGKAIVLYVGAEGWVKLINIARSMLLEMTNGKLED